MGTAAARALILQRIQLHGSNHLVHPASSARQLNSGPLSVPPFTRSNWNPVSRNSNWVDACKSFNLSTATEFTIHTNNSIVTRAGLAPARFGSPRADLLVSSYGFSQGLASVMCYNSSVASTSGSSERHQAQESRPKEEEKKVIIWAIGNRSWHFLNYIEIHSEVLWWRIHSLLEASRKGR